MIEDDKMAKKTYSAIFGINNRLNIQKDGAVFQLYRLILFKFCYRT